MNTKYPRLLLVGGTFDTQGGKISSVIEKVRKAIEKYYFGKLIVSTYNSGEYSKLDKIIKEEVPTSDIVIWWPNVPNELDKVRNIKAVNYKTMLITSKRNDNNKYSYQDILQRMLEQKVNLNVIIKSQDTGLYNFELLDPLSNMFYSGDSIEELTKAMIDRALFLKDITRQSTTTDEENKGALAWYFNMFKSEMVNSLLGYNGEEQIEVEHNIHFLEVIKDYAKIFASTIFGTDDEVEIKRFLGNASFRCPKGFPSFKYGDYILVSKRNVNKEYITIDDFVPIYEKEGNIYYLGKNKPSVDSPVQLQLYKAFPHIKYMLHAHVYIYDEKAPFTKQVLPCGALEEVDEIINCVYKNNLQDNNLITINLNGHGCIIMSTDVEGIESVKDKIIARPKPEWIYKDIEKGELKWN